MRSSSEDDYARELVKYYPRLVRYFMRKIPHEAEDLAREALVAAWRARDGFRGDANVGTLAFRISMRLLSRRRRELSKMTYAEDFDELLHGMSDEWPDTTDADEEKSWKLTIALQGAIEKLDPALSQIVELSYVSGKTQYEISQILRLPPGTVASRLRRAKGHLRSELSHAGAHDEEPTGGSPTIGTIAANRKKM